MLRRILLMLTAMLAIVQFSHAQVTTSSIAGMVKDAGGQPLEGATVTAVHTPSGTTYSTVATKNGVFNLPNVRIGGPYTIRITFTGRDPFVVENAMLELGQPYNVNAVLGQGAQALESVVVTNTRSRRVLADRTGMSTNITNRQITALPTITRSITDFTRLTPQANGTSFAGRDNRFNNITIDGANLNNNFGTSNDPLPGAGNNPVSLDAIDEISVNIAPFDVRQGQFTGGNIAASTKSGTNTFRGTAYTFWQNQSLVGKDAAGSTINVNPFNSKIIGGSIGGPIIKNKLFFFVNGEYENKPPAAGIAWTPKGGSGLGNVSDVPVDSLRAVANYVTSKGFNPGAYDNFPNFNNTNHKALGKIDWNISNTHKLTLKYSDFKGTQDFQPSQSGGINGANNAGVVTYGPKFSKTAMGFYGTTYQQVDIVRSGSLELNSSFKSKFANQFLATLTKISSDKKYNGDGPFPFVDILGATAGSKNNFISVGNEPFNGNNNSVINDVLTITDNFSYFVGKHTFTAGLSYEYQKVGNMFMAGSQGYYVFRSVDDFVNNRAPALFSITYSLDPNQPSVYSANLKIGQAAAYIQDEINVNPKLKVTAGIRADKPVYIENPLENPAISALNLYADNTGKGATTHYTTGQWPKATILLSPRVGFRYDVFGDKSLNLRGGAGIFTGRIPFVYLTNVPSGSAMYQYGTLITDPAMLQNFKFDPNPRAYNPFYNTALATTYPTYFPTSAGKVAPNGAFALTSRDFQFPQILRLNLGADKQFANNWRASVEGLYTKDINAVYMFNANQNAPNSTVTTGSYTRGYYTNAAARKLNSAPGNAVVLDNTSKGHSLVLTAQVSKTFSNKFFGSVAYNFTSAKDVTANPGSQAASVWSANPTSQTQNDLELYSSSFAVPHRVVASASYRFEYAQHFATTVSLFYEGRNSDTYTYIYNGDLNNDGNSSDLMYIPRDPSEIKFKEDVKYNNGVTYTAQQQSDIFFKYIEQDPYLRSHKGQVAGRNEAKLPWYHRVDAKLAQDLFTNIGSRRQTLQFTADIYNVLNLISHDWGVRKQFTVANPLKVESVSNGVPVFSLTQYNNAPISQTFVNNITTSTTYSIQLGLRYIF